MGNIHWDRHIHMLGIPVNKKSPAKEAGLFLFTPVILFLEIHLLFSTLGKHKTTESHKGYPNDYGHLHDGG